jgi:predicted nucleic acid-binding protein
LSSDDALGVVEANFLGRVKIAALEAETYSAILRGAPATGVSGGRIYDAVIAACARKEKVQTLLTFNESHFRQFAGSDLLVVVP